MTSLRSRRITPLSNRKVYYSDFLRNFDLNPISGALEVVANEAAVMNSIQNLIMTSRGERFYNLDVGSDVQQSLFNPLDNITTSGIVNSIEMTIKNYEPRATNVQVGLTPTTDGNGYIARISFSIINIPNVIHTVDIPVFRVR